MQKFFGLILALGLTFSLYAQGGPAYTVQVGTFLDSKSADFDAVKSYGFLYATELGGNMSRIYMGGYNSFEAAEAVAQQARAKGYLDATVVQLDPARGQTVTVIQLGVRNTKQDINWEKFQKAGRLFVLLNNQQIKIVTGLYSSVEAANPTLQKLRKAGFDDAFVKNVNSVLLHEVDAFITGAPMVAAAIPEDYGYDPADASPASSIDPIPEDYDIIAPVPKGATAPERPKPMTVSEPNIRSNIKRTSALDLQRYLKKEGSYKSSLDGYYGRGTSSAYDEVYRSHPTLQRYKKLAAERNFDPSANATGIQKYINEIPYNPAESEAGLIRDGSAISMAYRAYILFVNGQTGSPVNNLMNQAINSAFSGKKVNPVPNFDYKASYAYENLGQLIQHVAYIHAASGDADVPCWLFQQHPSEAKEAFDPSSVNAAYSIENCGGFTDWNEVKVLLTIAEDMSATMEPDPARIEIGQSVQTRNLLAPKALSSGEASSLETWHMNLKNNLAAWALKDPMLEEIHLAFGVAFYQTQVLLEDYFMDKGLNSGEAESLALSTLKAMVGPYMIRFMK
ncbi:MAG: hypothetical protein GYB31_03710 [Bacteroidetes bacterium]|nr:hypothetical protein [Bacteroidota bacterium]